jgi:nicotinamidase-related amidase
MLIEKDKSALLIIDVQEKLVSAMPKPHKFIDNIIKLLKAANILEVTVSHSEQYPKGLGWTIKKIQEHIERSAMQKVNFSLKLSPEKGTNFIICGIEAHVCVLQTAIELADADMKVYVVQDAISSRYEKDYLTALSRLDKHPNIQIVSYEMVLFEWLRTSDHPEFKTISQLIK